MTTNENGPQVVMTPRDREDLAAGEAAATVAQAADAVQQNPLFPVRYRRPVARPLVLITRGRVEYLARCPHCKNMHRHTHLGRVTGACGKTYDLEPRGRRAAA